MKFSQLSFHWQEFYFATFSIIITVTLFSLLMNLVGKSHKNVLIADSLMLIIEFIYLIFLYEGYAIKVYSLSDKISTFGNMIYNTHVLISWVISIILLLLSILSIVYSYHWSKRHLGKTSIKEGIDKLPTGLSFCYNNGRPILTNATMNDICSIITGKPLMNGKEFYDACYKGIAKEGNVFIKTGEMPIVKLKNGTIKSFKYSKIENDVYEIIATDVSSQYELGIELENKNEELKKMNARLTEYGKHIEIMTRYKEILAAKIRIHDELGHLLLFLKKSLQTNSSFNEKEEMLSKWRKVTTLLTSEKEKINMFEELLSHSKALGIKLKLNGEMPSKKYLQEVIFIAIMECLTNTYAHAKGDLLLVTIDDSNEYYRIICTNNGIVPKNPIKEGGGLSSLRSMIERINGTMKIDIYPQFILTILLPKGEIWKK